MFDLFQHIYDNINAADDDDDGDGDGAGDDDGESEFTVYRKEAYHLYQPFFICI